jgi:mono/diheme cytochrome c family protein
LTEIPEHLLKRSRERRAALGLGGGDATEGAPAEAQTAAPGAPAEAEAATPAAQPAAAVEEPAPEPPKPEPAYIQAAKSRKRIPYWAMTALAALPLWGYMYVRTLEPPPEGDEDPLALGADVYSGSCASCHGGAGDGAGGAPGFLDGAVVETFPDVRDHIAWVKLGSDGWPSATYGAQDTPKAGGMPPWPTLTDAQLAEVVLHERQLAGEEVSEDNEDYAELYAIALGEMTVAEAGLGPEAEEAGVTEADLGG